SEPLDQLAKCDRSKALGFYSALSGEMANFPLYITASYEGYMVCVASVQNNTVIQPTVSQRHHLRVVEVVVQSGSVEFYEGKPLSLRCNIAKGNHVSYQWLVDGNPLPLSPLHNQTQEQLFIYRYCIDSGEYTCVATNQLNITKVYSSRSTAKVIKVKELVSEPDLLFLVLKERGGTYFALVTCQSLNGTPPITFSLYSRSEFISTETVDERFATFSIPVVLDLHMGFLQCQAQNGDRVVYGQWTAMHVVSVGGAVTMHYDTDVGENFSIVGLRFYCSVERGTFPQYRWFLNGTVLEGRGEFYWVENQPEQSILLLSVGRSSAGTYHCEVSDSFDGTTVISSEARYIDKEDTNPFWQRYIESRYKPMLAAVHRVQIQTHAGSSTLRPDSNPCWQRYIEARYKPILAVVHRGQIQTHSGSGTLRPDSNPFWQRYIEARFKPMLAAVH
uniref:Si:dkey-93h22.7 n=1 Tax=Oncorhynchus mykiss TaxID=8022 RepID=A0A8K9Y0V3_ONCMY